eukprot:scaffold3077_cov162-Amphora_coffeaeformis.AAC.43
MRIQRVVLALSLAVGVSHSYIPAHVGAGGRRPASRRPFSSRGRVQQSSALESPTKSSKITSDVQVIRVLKEIRVTPPWTGAARINTLTFNFVLRNLLSSSYKVRNAGERAEEILRYMMQSNRDDIKPNLISLNTVLAIYSKNSSRQNQEAAVKADELRKDWENLYKSGQVEFDTDRISLNTVMSAFVRAGSINDARRIFGVLKARYQETNRDDIKPDAVSCATLLRGYANSGKVREAERLFQTIKNEGPAPTVECFNEVLYAYSKSTLPARAEEFLKVWSEDADEPVRPDVRSYNTVLHALSNNRDPSAILRAERLLNRMPVRDAASYTTFIYLCCRLPGHMALDATDRTLQKASRDTNVVMDPPFITNVLYSLSNCDDRDMLPYAESLVEKLIESGQEPTVGLYNALLHCWAKSADRDAGRRALAILNKIRETPNLKPDIKTYTNVLDCLTKSRDTDSVAQAELIVEKMEAEGPLPSTQTYTALIQNYARSRIPLKAVKAAEILHRMNETGRADAKPTIVSYNAVLNAAEHTDGSVLQVREEALKVACIAFDEIRNSTISPSHVTYGTFLGVLTNLMAANMRQHIVSLVFKRCCIDGQVSYLVLKKLKTAVETREQYSELLMGHNENRLPEAWTCNVREAKARDIL